jgi:ATP-dependent Clp protease ATP-binding subunit ClpA
MFDRYTEDTKKAIYFAAHTALHEDAAEITSAHLLLGLVTNAKSRANNIFRLCEMLPDETARQSSLKIAENWDLVIEQTSPRPPAKKEQTAAITINLGQDGKRILAYTASEANLLQDYWIDDEHLVLGILRENENAAAIRLRAIGLDLETARRRIVENIRSRPQRPNPVIWWVRRRSIGLALVVVFLLGVLTALTLLGFGGLGIAITIVILAIGRILNSMAQRRSFRVFGSDDL